MGATNKTTNYELPQWIGTDKPTFLGDMNDAFLKIDTGMAENKDSATSAESIAGASNSKATEAHSLAQEANTLANQANTTATQAQQAANTAQSTAQTALEKANQAIAGTANAWQNISWTPNNSTVNTGLSAGFVSYNAALNMLGIALYFNAQDVGGGRWGGRTKLCTLGAPVRPAAQRIIRGAGCARGYNWDSDANEGVVVPQPFDVTIEADGSLYIQPPNNRASFGNSQGAYIAGPQEVGIQLMLATFQWGMN